MKLNLSRMLPLASLTMVAGLAGCGGSDASEPTSQAEAELVAERNPADEPNGAGPSADPSGEQATGPRGRRGRHHGAHGHHGPQGHRDPARLIARFDADGDGVLTLEELPARKRDRLSAADADGDGALSEGEITAHFEAKHQKRFERKDRDGDGFLTEDELGPRRWARMKAADADGDDRLTAEEIRTAFESGALRHHGKRRGRFGRHLIDAPPSPEKFIERFDDDGSGTLELSELPGRMSKKMAKADADGDGSLTADELRQGMVAFAKKRFERKDENGDGFLTEDEVPGHKWKWLSAADADQDGKVSFDELTVAFESGALEPPRHHRRGGKGDRGRGRREPGPRER